MRQATPRAKFGFLIHDVSRMRRTFFDQALKPLGITRAQWWALGNISRHADEGMIQTELAHILETGKVSVGGLIDRLEEAELVYRSPDKVDRRVKRIFITDKGFAMLDHIAKVGEMLDTMLFNGISDAELAATADVIARAKVNLRAALKTSPLAAPLPARRQSADRGKKKGATRRPVLALD